MHGSGPNFTALEGKYHKACYRTYWNKVRLSSANKNSQLKKRASAALLRYVEKLVMKQNVPILVSSLLKTYKDFFLLCSGNIAVLEGYTVQNMRRKSNTHMGNAITVTSNKKKTATIVYKTDAMSFQQALQLVATSQESAQNTIQECANILRRDILTLEKTPLHTSSVDTVMKGEVSITYNVNFVFRKLYKRDEGTVSTQKQRFIDSSLADVVYCCSGTKTLAGKHITHALTLKSMTSSKRVVTLEQRNGHCVRNETAHIVEMGLEEVILFHEDINYVSDGVLKQPGLCVGMAWDNFDINIETLNGLRTIHHIYGIVYQNISSAVAEVTCIPVHRNSGHRCSKVSCNAKNDTIEPCYKKSKISEHEFTSQEFLPAASF